MTPKTPLLDLGNVIVQVDFAPFLSWLAAKAGHGEAERMSGLLRSSLFYDFEFGNLGAKEFAERLRRLYGIDFSQNEFEERFCGIFPGLVAGMESALTELASVGPIYCLSNTNEIHLSYCRREFPILGQFTKIFASHEIRKRKPYPGIYVDVARELELEPRQLVFFDDVHANVQGALRAGLEAHLFQDSHLLRTVLQGEGKTDDNEP